MVGEATPRPLPAPHGLIRGAAHHAGHTVHMNIWYGANVADEAELRLCGDVSGKRVIELGIAAQPNSLTVAHLGAKAIALDPDARAIAALRSAADDAEVRVECHQGDLADLGFVTSGSVDLVITAHSITPDLDLPRLLRQVHRVLKPGASFVAATTHPVAMMFESDRTAVRPYGHGATTFADLYMAFVRSNFHLDAISELNDHRVRDALCPSVLVMRARKQGV